LNGKAFRFNGNAFLFNGKALQSDRKPSGSTGRLCQAHELSSCPDVRMDLLVAEVDRRHANPPGVFSFAHL
jgi:hypothetical protein